MAGLRCVFDHPQLLADDSSACRQLARAPSFPSSLTVYRAVARVGSNVGGSRADHAALAKRATLSRRLGLGGSGFAVHLRPVRLFAVREEFQRAATRWIA